MNTEESLRAQAKEILAGPSLDLLPCVRSVLKALAGGSYDGTNDNLKEKAARGARLLDQLRPGWFRQIIIDFLDQHSNRNCVIGQLDGSYVDNIHKYCSVLSGEQQYYGFGVFAGHAYAVRHSEQLADAELRLEHDYAELTGHWKQEIIDRRTA